MKKTIILSSALLAITFYACNNSENKSETVAISDLSPGVYYINVNNKDCRTGHHDSYIY